jgi:hypothetical protein
MNEPNAINLTATSFTLSVNRYDNYIFGDEHNLQNIQENQYLWAVSETENGNISNLIKSAHL